MRYFSMLFAFLLTSICFDASAGSLPGARELAKIEKKLNSGNTRQRIDSLNYIRKFNHDYMDKKKKNPHINKLYSYYSTLLKDENPLVVKHTVKNMLNEAFNDCYGFWKVNSIKNQNLFIKLFWKIRNSEKRLNILKTLKSNLSTKCTYRVFTHMLMSRDPEIRKIAKSSLNMEGLKKNSIYLKKEVAKFKRKNPGIKISSRNKPFPGYFSYKNSCGHVTIFPTLYELEHGQVGTSVILKFNRRFHYPPITENDKRAFKRLKNREFIRTTFKIANTISLARYDFLKKITEVCSFKEVKIHRRTGKGIRSRAVAPKAIPYVGAFIVRGKHSSGIIDSAATSITKLYAAEHLDGIYEGYYFIKYITLEKSRKKMLSTLRFALINHRIVDVYVFDHSNTVYSLFDWITPELRKKIRFVYNAGCGDASKAKEWMRLGIKSYIGHIGDSISPLFTSGFFPLWIKNRRLDKAVAAANKIIPEKRGLGRIFLKLGGQTKSRANLNKHMKGTIAKLFGKKDLRIRDVPRHRIITKKFNIETDRIEGKSGKSISMNYAEAYAYTMAMAHKFGKFQGTGTGKLDYRIYKNRLHDLLHSDDSVREAIPFPGYNNLREFSKDPKIMRILKDIWERTEFLDDGTALDRKIKEWHTTCEESRSRIKATMKLIKQKRAVVWQALKGGKPLIWLVYAYKKRGQGLTDFYAWNPATNSTDELAYYDSECKAGGYKIDILY